MALVAVVVLWVASGCGSGSSSGATSSESTTTAAPTTPLSKPEFARRANAICRNAAAQRREAQKEAIAKGEEVARSEEAKVAMEALVAPVGSMTEELAELGAPKGEEKQVEAIIAAFEAGIESLEANPVSSHAATAFARADKLAVEYGLTDCVI